MRRPAPTARRRALAVTTAVLLLGVVPAAAVQAADGTVSVGDATVVEPAGKTGQVAVEVPVTLNPAAVGPVSVGWRTVAGTAGTADFLPASGTLVIPAGAQGGAIAVGIRADRVAESLESFAIELTSATGAALGDAAGLVEIRPASSGLALGDVVLVEPDGGALSVGVAATLPSPARKPVSFDWQLRSGSGTVGEDVIAASGTGVLPKGALGTFVRVEVLGDATVEPDETLELLVTSSTNASVADGLGVITVRNTDVAPPPPPDPLGWQPPDGAVPASGTALYLESSPGDYIGQGRTYLYTLANSELTVTTKEDRVDLVVAGDEDWRGQWDASTTGTEVVTGYWQGGRYPFAIPGLTFTGEGRGCNNVVGRYSVDAVGYDPAGLASLTLRFEQRCDGDPPLRGFLRYDRSDATVPPPPGDPADFPWSPPPGAVPETGDYLYFESAAGDYIGQGRTELYTETDSTFVPDWGGPIVQLFVNPGGAADDWSATFSGPDAMAQLEVGLYDELGRYPFHNPVEGGLSFTGEGRGCNELAGAFAVDEISWSGTELASVSIRFVQRCEETGPPLYGAYRWTAP